MKTQHPLLWTGLLAPSAACGQAPTPELSPSPVMTISARASCTGAGRHDPVVKRCVLPSVETTTGQSVASRPGDALQLVQLNGYLVKRRTFVINGQGRYLQSLFGGPENYGALEANSSVSLVANTLNAGTIDIGAATLQTYPGHSWTLTNRGTINGRGGGTLDHSSGNGIINSNVIQLACGRTSLRGTHGGNAPVQADGAAPSANPAGTDTTAPTLTASHLATFKVR